MGDDEKWKHDFRMKTYDEPSKICQQSDDA